MNARFHRDRNGVEYLVAEMTDEHLINTIVFWVDKLKKAEARLDKPKMTKFQNLLYRYDEEDDEQWAAGQIEAFFIFAPRYFLEAFVRGISLEHVRGELTNILERDHQMRPVAGLLSGGDYEEDYLDPDDIDPDEL